MLKGRLCLARRGVQPWIAILDGVLRENVQDTSQRGHLGLVGQQEVQQDIEVVRLGNGNSVLLQQCLEVLLGGLLAMEAERVMDGWSCAGQLLGGHEVRLGLPYPLGR